MLYSIGYQRLRPEELLHVAEALDAVVVDCRARPFSRKAGFGKKQIAALLGERYLWKGDVLGGPGGGSEPTADGLDWLVRYGDSRNMPYDRNLLLLCLEEAPGDCHRHLHIGAPLAARGVEVRHIYRDEVFTAAALEAALRDPDPDAEYALLDEPSPLGVSP